MFSIFAKKSKSNDEKPHPIFLDEIKLEMKEGLLIHNDLILLPDEIVLTILTFLDLKSLGVVSTSSKRFHSLALSNWVWKLRLQKDLLILYNNSQNMHKGYTCDYDLYKKLKSLTGFICLYCYLKENVISSKIKLQITKNNGNKIVREYIAQYLKNPSFFSYARNYTSRQLNESFVLDLDNLFKVPKPALILDIKYNKTFLHNAIRELIKDEVITIRKSQWHYQIGLLEQNLYSHMETLLLKDGLFKKGNCSLRFWQGTLNDKFDHREFHNKLMNQPLENIAKQSLKKGFTEYFFG